MVSSATLIAIVSGISFTIGWFWLSQARTWETNRRRVEAADALFDAVKNNKPGDADLALAAGAELEGVDVADGVTPLQFACMHFLSPTRAQWLLDRGADPNNVRHYPDPALVLVARNHGDLRPLVERGANVNATGRDGRSPLHLLAGSKKSPVNAQVLLSHGANPNARDLDGNTPLHCAVMWGDQPLADLLLDSGGAPALQMQNKANVRPADLAVGATARELLPFLEGRTAALTKHKQNETPP